MQKLSSAKLNASTFLKCLAFEYLVLTDKSD